jgi:hypothetical protein
MISSTRVGWTETPESTSVPITSALPNARRKILSTALSLTGLVDPTATLIKVPNFHNLRALKHHPGRLNPDKYFKPKPFRWGGDEGVDWLELAKYALGAYILIWLILSWYSDWRKARKGASASPER